MPVTTTRRMRLLERCQVGEGRVTLRYTWHPV
jgi:hypothetical protein